MVVRLANSRKFWLSLVSLISVLLAHYTGLPVEVQQAIVAVFGVLVASIAFEDAANGVRRDS